MLFDLPSDLSVYSTNLGIQLCGDSRDVLKLIPEESVDLIITSPPFALLRKKSYGNRPQEVYVDWLLEFGREALRVLKSTGSFVLDLGGAYQRGKPVRSLYNYRILIAFCDTLGYRLAEEFFWYNPAKLPSPIEWVNKRKIRAKDAVNTIWWLSKSDFPKADVKKVLVPYSKRMKKLLEDPDKFYTPKERPSGHAIGKAFGSDKGGAIPPNLLQIPNTASNSHYLRCCKALGKKSHPARFPADLPRFFIKFLTDPGDIVVDIFSGSNTTGYVAEELRRHWLGIEINREFAWLSAVRFMEEWDLEAISEAVERMKRGENLNIDEMAPVEKQMRLPIP
jgi:site-specific DNA-methyltransferase (cytosine-N4-specific)